MKILVPAIALVALVGCEQSAEQPAKPISEAAPEAAQRASARGATAPPPGVKGTVIETMDSGGYTYVKLNTGAPENVWAAGPTTAVKVGDVIGFTDGMVMNSFESKSLNRVFDRIYFASAFQTESGGAASQAGASEASGQSEPAENGKIEIKRAAGEMSVEEVYAQSAKLVGKSVRLRGKVVKYNSGIMGRNWLHIQDGTGAEGTNDLTVTTTDTAKEGDMVVVEGVLATDKDFGAGYTYSVVVEEAKLVN